MLQSGEQKQTGCQLENGADEEHGWRWQLMFAGFVGTPLPGYPAVGPRAAMAGTLSAVDFVL